MKIRIDDQKNNDAREAIELLKHCLAFAENDPGFFNTEVMKKTGYSANHLNNLYHNFLSKDILSIKS